MAQDKSNRGKEFWLGYGLNYHFYPNNDNVINDQELALYISTEQAAAVTVSINGTSWTQTINIPANTVDASILVPKSGAADARLLTDGLSDRGIHIVSDVPVAVFAHQYSPSNSGATMLMPVESYGYSYYSVNYYQTTADLNQPNWYGYFYAVASEDNTKLEITPSDSTQNGWLPGQTNTITLNKGQIFCIFGKAVFDGIPAHGSKDLTGSKIISVPGTDGNCHPFTIFSGSGGIRLCRGDGAEVMHQQVFPVQAWGTTYLTYHTINNGISDLLETNRNYYRICVADPATIVKKNGVIMTGLQKGFYYEYMDSTGGDYIQANKPVLVAQYTPNKNQCWKFPTTTPSPPSFGDPEMIYLSPLEQGQKSVILWASRQSNAITYVYYHIVLPTTAVGSLKVDGNSLPASQIIPHPNLPSYSVALGRHIGAAATHIVTCDSNFTGIIYGLGSYESYGYNIGARINNLNNYSTIKNTYNTSGNIDTFTCPKTPVRLFVKLAFPANTITWKLSQVPGIIPNTDSVISNPVPVNTEIIFGRTYYVYTLQQDFTFATAGTFYIPVTYTSTVIPNCSQSENATIKVMVHPGPAANFSISPQNCLNDTLSFTGTSAAGGFTISSYLWNFDDATSQGTVNARKHFTTPGLQNVRYRIYADNGCTGDTTKPVTILPNPIARLGVTSPVCLKDTSFISDTSAISSGTITNWRYLIEPIPVATINRNINNTFPYIFKNPGNFKVSLITTGSNGCLSDTAFKTVVVLPIATAKFSYDKNICLGDSILFTDASTFASGSITSWKWDFGDGKSATYFTNAPLYHKYTATGAYTVALVVNSNNGCSSDTFKLNVTVNNKPTATITSVTGKPCIDSSFNFISSQPYSATNPANWYWNFGDGQVSSITSSNMATHVFNTTATNVTVKHVVSYGPGCYSDTAQYIIPVIHPNPAAVPFTISNNAVCAKTSVQFSTAAVTGISNWLWNFGDGIGTQVPPFGRTYNNAGNFSISLVVSNAGGCNSPATANAITVSPIPAIDAGTDKQISTGASVTLDASISSPANYTYLWTPSTYLNNAGILNPLAAPTNNITYTITATDNSTRCTASDSAKVIVISKLFIPNAFSPNGDGINDTWNIPAMILYPEASVLIFNRYGQVIYQTKNYIAKPWNGSYKGKQQPGGTYVYVIKFAAGNTEKGTITIVR